MAALGVWSSHRWQLPMLDGVASIAIGMLLTGVAVLLVRESRGLLIGEDIRASTECPRDAIEASARRRG